MREVIRRREASARRVGRRHGGERYTNAGVGTRGGLDGSYYYAAVCKDNPPASRDAMVPPELANAHIF